MDTSNHFSYTALFEQLGLPSEPAKISQFIQNHQLSESEPIENATFWSPSQAAFIKEAIQNDSDWAEVVDHLSVDLRP